MPFERIVVLSSIWDEKLDMSCIDLFALDNGTAYHSALVRSYLIQILAAFDDPIFGIA